MLCNNYCIEYVRTDKVELSHKVYYKRINIKEKEKWRIVKEKENKKCNCLIM